MKPQLHTTPAGKVCLCNSQGWGSTLLFFSKLCSPYYWGSLALNQGQRCGTSWLLITKEMLTYFQRSEKEMLRAAGATCETEPLELRKLRILRWKINHKVEIKIHPWARVKRLLLADKKTKDSHGTKVVVKTTIFPWWRLLNSISGQWSHSGLSLAETGAHVRYSLSSDMKHK